MASGVRDKNGNVKTAGHGAWIDKDKRAKADELLSKLAREFAPSPAKKAGKKQRLH